MFWTLAIEAQYYIVMIFAAPVLIGRSDALRASFFAAAAVLSLVPGNTLIFPYLPFFGMGFVALILYRRVSHPSWCAVWLAVFTALAFRNAGMAATCVGLVTTAAIFIPIKHPIPLLTFAGSISYSLYLLHVPIGTRIIHLMARLPQSLWLQFAGLCAAILATVIAAWLLWVFVENPTARKAKNIGAQTRNAAELPRRRFFVRHS